ncbi:MAG TPA: MBL fold metallo-hydrolase [Poseidonia sp.]|nr:MBL fold metallo-hydrolase [Poseidonia sp.]
MKVVRLPAIHHDGNAVIVSGRLGSLLIDAGTSWYQSLQVERIKGQLGDGVLDRIVLTTRRYPCAGGAKHISESFGNIPIHIQYEGQAALETGDFFTTWANRFDSDMPPTQTIAVEDDEIFALGDGDVKAISLPGHAPEGMGYLIAHLSTLVVGPLLPRADRPTRWDLPGGSLIELIKSFETMKRLRLKSLVPMQGPAIRGEKHVQEVIERHLRFFNEAANNDGNPPKSWHRPASTALWLTPISPWPLEEKESV